ncbi:MAG TPA: iron-containing redox enzyme family protein [Burkholderiales bacterium]|nr:iron-containing redox enzyme family protein [Burkholderiales bacterium]
MLLQIENKFKSYQDYISKDNIVKLKNSKFIIKCLSEGLDMPKLKNFIEQHYYYSKNFVHYMCALLSNLSNEKHFSFLLENLLEECGKTETSKVVHLLLYQQMLDHLNIKCSNQVLPVTQRLIDNMFNYCRNIDPIYGLSALGLGAEAIVPTLYSAIIKNCEKLQIPDNFIHFFKLHVTCDDGHADIMKLILNFYIGNDPKRLQIVRAVSAHMINLRVEFLDFFCNEHTNIFKKVINNDI